MTGPPPLRPPTAASRAVGLLPAGVRTLGGEVGGMAQLAGKLLWSAIRHPRGYWRAVLDETYRTLKVASVPMILSVFCYGLFVGVLALTWLRLIGANYLYGPTMVTSSMRNFSTWINAMVVAGVVGAALTADLGARRIREELDALEVLGVDPVRTLVLPRVVSATIITGLLSVVSITVSIVDTGVSTYYVSHLPFSDYFGTVFNNLTPVEEISYLVNNTLIGFLIGVVCAYKGLHTKPGAIGVGRAVNQAVVVAFLGIFVVQFVYQAIVLALFPTMGTMR